MSLVSNLAQALIQAAQKEGVDPREYLSKAIAGSTSDTCQAGEQPVLEPIARPTKRPYKRVVPEGDIAEMDLGTIAIDSKGRWHELVELRAFADKTRRSWKLLADYKPPEPVFYNQATEAPRSLVDYSDTEDEDTVDTEDEATVHALHQREEMRNTDSDSSGKTRKPYTSKKPESSAKSQEMGTIADGKDGTRWVVKQFTGRRGTRNQWCRYKPEANTLDISCSERKSTPRPVSAPEHHTNPDPETLASIHQVLQHLGVSIPAGL